MATFSWADDFETGGEMHAVQKAADGLRLGLHYALDRNAGTWAYQTDHPDFFLQEFTMEALIFPIGTGLGRIVGQWGAAAAGVSAVLSYGTDPPTPNRRVSLITYGAGRSHMAGATIVPQNQWSHVAATFASGLGRVYYRGNLDGELSGMVLPHDGNYNISVAGEQNGIYGLPGYVAEVRWWSRALSPEEIAANQWRMLRGDEPGLIAYWRLNEASGTVAYDSGPRGHHLTVVGGARATFKRYGARLVILDLSGAGIAQFSSVAWQASEPDGTGVVIETSLSLDGGSTWRGWKVCTNGGSIPDIEPGTDLTNARLKVWEHLHTTDPAVEPVLSSLVIVISGRQSTGRPRGRVVPAGSAGRIHPVAHEGRVHPWS